MTTIGLLLALCVCGTFGQTTQSEFSCYLDSVFDLAFQNPGCATALGNAFQVSFSIIRGLVQTLCAKISGTNYLWRHLEGRRVESLMFNKPSFYIARVLGTTFFNLMV